MRTIRCVVLDLDDTLYLERDYVRSGFCAVGRHLKAKHGIEGFASLAWREFENGRREDIFNNVIEILGRGDDKALVQQLVKVYRKHNPSIVLEPDSLEFMRAARLRTFMAVITDGPLESQKHKATALDLDALVDLVVFTEELGPGKGKPALDAFEQVQRAAGVPASSCIYLGDNPAKDFQGPLALGWMVARVHRSQGLYVDAVCQEEEITEFDKLPPEECISDFLRDPLAYQSPTSPIISQLSV